MRATLLCVCALDAARSFSGRKHLDRARERAQLTWLQRADADELAHDLLAALVRDRHDDRVLQRFRVVRVTDRALDAQRRRGREQGVRAGCETKMLPA